MRIMSSPGAVSRVSHEEMGIFYGRLLTHVRKALQKRDVQNIYEIDKRFHVSERCSRHVLNMKLIDVRLNAAIDVNGVLKAAG